MSVKLVVRGDEGTVHEELLGADALVSDVEQSLRRGPFPKSWAFELPSGDPIPCRVQEETGVPVSSLDPDASLLHSANLLIAKRRLSAELGHTTGFGGSAEPGDTTIKFDGLQAISFRRTLRIPDGLREYPLPPGLGRFPLVRVADCPGAPESWRQQEPASAAFVMPLYQREAMWMSFDGSEECAVRIRVGGINAVSGEPCNPDVLSKSPQDYVVCPKQPWLDGIHSGRGAVRQFVAMPLGKGYVVEGQVSGSEDVGCLQIDVIPPLVRDIKATVLADPRTPTSRRAVDCSKSPKELGLAESDLVLFVSDALNPRRRPALASDFVSASNPELILTYAHNPKLAGLLSGGSTTEAPVDFPIHVKTLRGDSYTISATKGSSIHEIMSKLNRERTLADYNIQAEAEMHMVTRLGGGNIIDDEKKAMQFAAGGRVLQKIYEDEHGPDHWFVEGRVSCVLYILDACHWRRIVCTNPPLSYITAQSYADAGLPWSDLYDEAEPSVPQQTTVLDQVKSVKERDTITKTEPPAPHEAEDEAGEKINSTGSSLTARRPHEGSAFSESTTVVEGTAVSEGTAIVCHTIITDCSALNDYAMLTGTRLIDSVFQLTIAPDHGSDNLISAARLCAPLSTKVAGPWSLVQRWSASRGTATSR
eukprot:m51a1_g12690 hypothetical protein (648) ;mRNA; r:88-3055